MAVSLPPRIDVHSHFLPPKYQARLNTTGHAHPDGMPAIPPWSPEQHLEMMDAANVTKSILSISSPGVDLSEGRVDQAVDVARECNFYAASLKKEYPDRFGYWASLPMRHVNASLEEIERASAEGADGFAMLTSVHGEYLGSPKYDAIFQELNQRNSVVFIHPTSPSVPCSRETNTTCSIAATPLASQYPNPVFEFLFDTARAVINLFLTGTIRRNPNIRFILPHVGGALPPLFSRFTGFSTVLPGMMAMDEEELRQSLESQFYFDLAGIAFAGQQGGQGQLKALIEGYQIGHDRLLYGSDFPFTPKSLVVQISQRMAGGFQDLFDDDEMEAIYEQNARKLLRGKGVDRKK